MSNTDRPLGGSELQYLALESRISSDILDRVNLILSRCSPTLLDPHKKNVLWQHLNIDQAAVQLLRDPNFVRRIDRFVFVSYWQWEQYRRYFDIPAHKSTVIRNAVETFDSDTVSNKKIKLIYTSTPWRGLDILLDAFELLGRSDIELDVFSSTEIYGPDFYASEDSKYQSLYERARQMPGVNFLGYADNNTVKSCVAQADIFAYPSTFEETSCISAIEAGMAGCKIVTTDLGALPETCSVWADYTAFDTNRDRLVKQYAQNLDKAINGYKSRDLDQIEFFQQHYCWDTRIREWQEFFNECQ